MPPVDLILLAVCMACFVVGIGAGLLAGRWLFSPIRARERKTQRVVNRDLANYLKQRRRD